MTNARNVTVLIASLLALMPTLANGQELTPFPPGAPQTITPQAPGYAQPVSDTMPPPMAAPQQPVYTQQQLEQLVAPIALYPDPLIGQILMASTYPLEVVEAERWHEDPQNAALTGPQLQAVLDQQPWDPSVKSLVATPQVLSMMNNNLQWTEQLGDAFLASQPGVMDSVQDLRHRAQAAGNLNSTPQQTVSVQPVPAQALQPVPPQPAFAGQPMAQPGLMEQQPMVASPVPAPTSDIIIEPTNPQLVYVPYYNPTVVYGAWPWGAYQPYYFPPPPGYVVTNVGLFGFGIGFAVFDWLWGWDHWDWYHHRILIDDHRFAALNRGFAPRFAGGAWAHDVDHRHGVPYRSPAVRQNFQRAATQSRLNYRGYFNAPNRTGGVAGNVHPAVASGAQHFGGAPGAGQPARSFGSEARTSTPQIHAPTAPSQPHVETPMASHTSQAHEMQPQSHVQAQTHFAQPRSAPMFESFSRGADVRTQSARGSTSRASMRTAAPQQSHSAPQARGGASGGGHGPEKR